MDRTSLPPPTTTEQEAAKAALLDAARDALEWLRRFQRHAPAEARFGGEEGLTRRLSSAVRMCSFEVRDCPECDDGLAYAPTEHPMERPRSVPCPSCGGTGRTRVFAYARPKARRGR
ncbi:MAG: hypothetical protein AVDCRST_MAG02-1726 [uncultured Rubrobacteraceae bacterium]|uniref:Uncharacterized protein n=1 Tax=uncultured Rubrobacteraceae bacterium TaxID=349277 RepID=A0A6J4R5B0_9ACTN|nr:MAG: hypothetical protein AVDCRST_MAG02-1726 [uncultured Rubrobacteraceae bacterium]